MTFAGFSSSAAHLAAMSSSSGLCCSRCSMTSARHTSGPRVSNSRETSSRAFPVTRGSKLIQGYSIGASRRRAKNSANSIEANLTIRHLACHRRCRTAKMVGDRAEWEPVREPDLYCAQIDGYQGGDGSVAYNAFSQVDGQNRDPIRKVEKQPCDQTSIS